MAQGWRQSWSDFLDSLRGRSPSEKKESLLGASVSGRREANSDRLSQAVVLLEPSPIDEETPDVRPPSHTLEATNAGDREENPTPAGRDGSTNAHIGSQASPVRAELRPTEQRKLSGWSFAVIALIAILATVPWLLSPYHFGADLFAPDPPAPDVVATFDGGRITLDDVESHLNLLVPSQLRDLTRSPEALLSIVEDLISDQLVLRWAADRKPEGEEAFRHAVKHINEELSLDAFASQLHEDAVPVAESQIRNYYEANASRFERRTFAESREQIRQTLVAKREPEFLENYIARLRTSASITRNFELLEVPPPGEEELKRYYDANVSQFALPRRFVVDEIEIPVSIFGDKAQQRASDLLLRIRGGASFKDVTSRLPGVRLSASRELAEGTRPDEWDKNVFALVPGELGSIFRAGGSFYVVRLNELKPARTRTLLEVRSIVAAAVGQQEEKRWFNENGQKTLFTLKGQRYSLEQFYKEYQELPLSLRGQYAGPEGLKELADSLIDRMLLVSDTYDKLLDVKTKPLADESRLRLLRRMMEQEEVDDKIKVTDKEVRSFYDENGKRMAYPPKARIRYIRIGLGASDDEERRAREKADQAYSKLAPGLFREGADFAAVAKEYSEDPESAAKGGEIDGWIGESGDPLLELADHPFHEAVLRLEPGAIGKPFQMRGSLYIVQVLERTEPEPLSFEQAKPFIEEVLTERRHRTLAVDLQKRLLRDANVVTYPKVLEPYIKGLPRSAQAGDEDK